MGKIVDTDSLLTASNALNTYMEEVSQSIQKMKDAAQDCSDNLENDEITKESIKKLNECIGKMNNSMVKARDLKSQIDAKYNQIIQLSRKN